MKRVLLVMFLAVMVCGLGCGNIMAEGSHRIGAGVHYWVAMDDIETDSVDENGMAYMFSYQYDTDSLLMFEANLEVFPEDMTGTSENLYAPQAFVLLGGGIYGGLGAGFFYYDGEFSDDPFYIIRVGLDMKLLPGIHLDINANYHFTDIGRIDDVADDVDTDTLTVGAMVRIEL